MKIKALAESGVPIHPSDVPDGIAVTPHPSGQGVTMDADAVVNYDPVRLLPEASALADLYRELLEGNPIGQVGMAGLVPEKLLWQTIAAYGRTMRVRLDRWTIGLLHSVDAIRLKYEFERLQKDAKK